MSYTDGALQMQKAIVARVNGDPSIGAPIFDHVEKNTPKPYISFGLFQSLPEHGDCLDGGEMFITLDAWAAGPQSVQIKQIGTALAKALDLAPLVLDAPQRLVEMTVEQIQYMRDPDNITTHAVLTIHAFIEPTA